MKKGLLVEGAELHCIHGSRTGSLQVPVCHGIQIGGRSLINEDDAKYPENIPNFGSCSITKKGCVPDILDEQWLFTESTWIVGGKPAVTTTACCLCARGGMIHPLETGQDDILAALFDPRSEAWLLFGLANGIFVADPINVCTGNFVAQKTDLEISGTLPLALKRTYNALDKRSGVLGRGWCHSFEVRLKDKKESIEVTHEDGRGEVFHVTPSGRYEAQDSCIRKKPKGIYELETAQGDMYTFDETGRCVEICDPSGNQTVFRYEGKLLASVENTSGSFTFTYDETGRLSSVSDSAERTVRYTYDSFGTLESAEDVLGAKTTYQYGSAHQILTISDSSGEPGLINEYDKKGRSEKQYFSDGGMIAFEYDDARNRTIVTEQNGNRVRYYQNEQKQNIRTVYFDGREETDYDEKGRKTRFRDKNGNETHFAYDGAGNLIQETNPLGFATVLEYNKQKLPTKITAAGGAVTQLAYDANRNLVSMTNPLGYLMRMQHHKGIPSQIDLPDGGIIKMSLDSKCNISAVQLPTGGVVRYEYDKLNRVIASVDGKGAVTKYTYNARNELTQIVNAEGKTQTYAYKSKGKISKVTDFDGGVIEYKYNSVGKVEEIVNQVGDSTKFTHDLMWNVTSMTDPCGNVTKYDYDKLQRLTRLTDAKGHATRFEHDPKGNVTAVISPLGARTEIVYDALDRQQKVTEPDGSVTEFAYDEAGNLVTVTDALGNVTKMAYDLAGQLVGLVDPLGNETSLAYTALGKISSVTNAKGETQTYSYYPGGLLKSMALPFGGGESYEYDQNGNISKKMDALGNATAFRYDALNRVIEVINPLGHSKKFAYDALNNITQMTDENGGVTQYKYSALGDMIEVIDASGHSTKYGYDAARRLTKLEQFRLIDEAIAGIQVPEYQVTTYEYDKNGKVIAVQTPLGTTEKFLYNGDGHLVTKVDGDGLKTHYDYNLTGQLEKISYADGKTVELLYNPLKQLTEMRDWLGTTTLALDPLGRPTEVTDFAERTVGYGWDSVGRREKTVYPDGKTVSYAYNPGGLLERVLAPEGETRYVYDSVGRPKERILPDSTRSRYSFDPLSRISQLVHSSQHGQMLDEFNYSFDPAGNITQIKKCRVGLETDSGLFQYGYDPLGRLTSVTQGKDVQRYVYDGLGNRVEAWNGDLLTRYGYNAANQLTHARTGDDTTEYGYDGRGNLTKVAENGQLKQLFAYDATNRMVQVATNGVGQALYTYDGFLNRVKKLESTTNTLDPAQEVRFILDRTLPYDNLLMTEEAQEQRFTWGNELISATGPVDMFYLQDHLGSPIRLMGQFPMGIAQGYDAFGVPMVNAPRNRQPFGFTGYEAEAMSGLYFAQARYYMPGAGRFSARDPHWHPGNMIYGDWRNVLPQGGMLPNEVAMRSSGNLYSYAMANPNSYVDKDGRIPFLAALGYAVKAIVKYAPLIVGSIRSYQRASATYRATDGDWRAALISGAVGFTEGYGATWLIGATIAYAGLSGIAVIPTISLTSLSLGVLAELALGGIFGVDTLSHRNIFEDVLFGLVAFLGSFVLAAKIDPIWKGFWQFVAEEGPGFLLGIYRFISGDPPKELNKHMIGGCSKTDRFSDIWERSKASRFLRGTSKKGIEFDRDSKKERNCMLEG